MIRVAGVMENSPSPHRACFGTGSRAIGWEVAVKASGTAPPAAPNAAGVAAAAGRTRSRRMTGSLIWTPGSGIRNPALEPGIPLPDGPVQRCLRAHFPEKCALDGFPEDLEEFGLIGHDHGEVASELEFTNGNRPSLPLRTGSLLSEVRIAGRLLRRRKDHRQLRKRNLILVACNVHPESARLPLCLPGLR